MDRVVVGIDGSEPARRALAWAIGEARRRGAKLQVVHTYNLARPSGADRSVYATSAPSATSAADHQELERRRDEALRNAQSQALGLINSALEKVDADISGITIDPVTVPDQHAERTLIDLSKGAELLVVGSRGRGAVAGRLLGSVSRACVEHAHCPVVVIPPAGATQ